MAQYPSDINTIVRKGRGHHDEGIAGTATIKPGMAIELMPDGKLDPVATAQAAYLKTGIKIAKEDALQGKTIDDAYAADDPVFYYEPVNGDEAMLLVKSGENIVVGDKLVPEGGGSGLWIEASAEAKFTAEALVTTGGALGANAHVFCRFTG